jgi:5-methylcytosine-specific restriction endonuclease McrA
MNKLEKAKEIKNPARLKKTTKVRVVLGRGPVKKKYKKKNIPKTLKKQVWDTWVGPTIGETNCLCCEHQKVRQIEFHCGHIKAEVTGGKTNVENLRPICAQCNLSMGSMNMMEFKEKFFSK